MRSAVRAVAALASAALLAAPSLAQTYTNCNPTERSDCPPDSALGRTVNIDFSAASDSFTPQGNIAYSSDGASFTVAKSGDAPQVTSKWYIMFGKVEVVLKSAPGAGIVSSFVMQSDTLDEIDWEWLGADNAQVQTNYFGKGQTTTYNRGAFHADPNNQNDWKTYTVEWTANQIVWSINGNVVRTLEPANADNQYPQTPMQIKIGAWSGGDSANAPGTIEWARGPTDYSQGPFSMHVKSLMVADYSTGTQYVYGDQSGTWQSIKSVGGKINSGGGSPVENPPAITSSASGQPMPFNPSETVVRPSVYPWIPDGSKTLSTAAAPTYANYPGLPSGWTVSDTGKVVPPSSAPSTSPPASSTPSPAASPSASSGDSESHVSSGFQTSYTAASESGNSLITQAPTQALPTPSANANVENAAVSSSVPPAPERPNSAHSSLADKGFVLLAAFIGALPVIL
ncbi:glycoside hydrolase family 16 protein [Aaosphaeria arxii CBS 175.79]|uniref:Crh-like protein n=1 Tax=Aaosphaeria arxii CBS 175.79 TaxID=1450172 RepID=A0A6A5XH34_9PLEO|nr:glycoside hydrolase family 16 protein [Aaosphaeria arxii CBS 175.79]KAF2012253.1 glycoside hydrolase family 16 protein [Aaosphaeria arxii CBS 175.79]